METNQGEHSVVYVVQHISGSGDLEDVKFIGVYQDRELANEAIALLKKKPGFAAYPENFYLDPYELDNTNWRDGFISV